MKQICGADHANLFCSVWSVVNTCGSSSENIMHRSHVRLRDVNLCMNMEISIDVEAAKLLKTTVSGENHGWTPPF